MSILDPNFHLASGWSKHVQSDGSNIAPGSPDPTNCGFVQGIPGHPDSLMLYNDGAAYSAVEIYTRRPLQVNTGRLQLDFDFTVDDPTQSQVFESDTKLVVNKKMFNFSLQRIAKTNMIQVSNQGGGWVDTGFVAPPLLPGQAQHHTFVYGFDNSKNGYGIQVVVICGVLFTVPYALLELTSTATTWPDGAYPQFQSCLGSNGGKTRLLYDNVTFAWS